MFSVDEIDKIVKDGKKILEEHSYKCDVTADELIQYFKADSYEEDQITFEDVLKNPLLVVHELVEITEIKKRGLKISKDVIIKNYDIIYEAHLMAADKELEVAMAMKQLEHIRDRIKDIKNWLEDPNLPVHLIERCRKLLERAKRFLNEIDKAMKKSHNNKKNRMRG